MSGSTQDRDSGKSRSSITTLIVIVVAVFVGIYVGCFTTAPRAASERVLHEIENNPLILEHLGSIEEIDLDVTATSSEPNDDMLVFELTGARSIGRLIVQVGIDGDGEGIRWGLLRLPNGEKLPLFDDQGLRPYR